MRMAQAGTAVGALVGATITLGITLLPRVFRRRGAPKQKKATAGETPQQQQQLVGKSLPELRPFGSPVDAKAKSGKGSTGPGTPTAGRPPLDVGRTRDQGGSPASSLNGVPAAGNTADAAAIEKQLQMLKAVEEENKKLKDFMSAHMQTSQKVKALEEENRVLKQLQNKLQGELEDIKAKALPSAFALSSGDELQSFKQMLASRIPLEARSVCSDALNGLGQARDTAASVDGAATVADFAAVRKRAPGFFSELASLLLLAPTANKASGGGAPPTLSRAPSGLNTPRSTYGGSVLGASSPVPSRQASVAQQPQQVHVDVGQLLESWAGGRL